MSDQDESGTDVLIVGGGVAGVEALLALHDVAGGGGEGEPSLEDEQPLGWDRG